MGKKQAGLTFEEPPTPRAQRYDWATIAEELKAKPGEWARVFDEDRSSLAVAIRQRSIKALSDPAFEVQTANNHRPDDSPRLCTLYLRYNPTKKRK